jgi:hypothetical protein
MARIRVHQSNSSAAVTNSLRLYKGRSAAILLMTSDVQNISDALESIFDLHDAKVVDPEAEMDWEASDVGDCTVKDDGVVLTIVGNGYTGIRFETSWGQTPDQWRMNAELNGCVWLGLVNPTEYQRFVDGGWGERIPSLPLLKLEVAT